MPHCNVLYGYGEGLQDNGNIFACPSPHFPEQNLIQKTINGAMGVVFGLSQLSSAILMFIHQPILEKINQISFIYLIQDNH